MKMGHVKNVVEHRGVNIEDKFALPNLSFTSIKERVFPCGELGAMR